jgi:hypothetical protein
VGKRTSGSAARAGTVRAMATTSPASDATPRTRPGVASAHRYLALAFLLAVVVQFILAGLIAFGHGARDAHSGLGGLLTLVSLILVVLAVVGRRAALPASITLFVLMIVQNVLGASGDDVSVLGALHPLNALLILFATMLTAAAAPVRFPPPGMGGAR